MNTEVMISYLPLYKEALLLTLEVGWKGVIIAFLLGLLGGAYMAETFRSGLENIPKIQYESAQSLGMNPI